MKNFILLLPILLIFTSCQKKQDIPAEENVEEVILAMEHQALDRWSAGDPAGYLGLFADDATCFDDIAAQTRYDGIEEIRQHIPMEIPPHTYELGDPKVQVYGDTAILTFHYLSTFNGEPGTPWKATDVFRRTNGDWHIVHAHWSLVKEQ